MLISETYRALNAELHSHGKYGLSGYKWAKQVDKLARACEARTVLDYGCGRGTLKIGLEEHAPLPYSIFEYDPAIAGKEEKPDRSDIVVCGDVLEHIEPDCLYPVLDDLAGIARLAVFLVVATVPAMKTLADGRNTHLIVESSDWWLKKILYRWRLDTFKDFGPEFMCIGLPR
jgi:hypothetical protein